MKCCMENHPHMLIYVFLDLCVLHATKIRTETNSPVVVVDVSSWDILMDKRDGEFMTLRLMNSLYHETWLSLKINFHSKTLKLRQPPQSPLHKMLIRRVKLMIVWSDKLSRQQRGSLLIGRVLTLQMLLQQIVPQLQILQMCNPQALIMNLKYWGVVVVPNFHLLGCKDLSQTQFRS